MADGHRLTLDRQFELVYQELRRLAQHMKFFDGSPTLTPTALVHEAYLQLSKSFEPQSPEHLKHTVVRAMRRLLIDAARRRATARRGGGAFSLQTPATPPDEPTIDPSRLLEINVALDRLQQARPLQALAFECHFFGGLPQTEIAEIAGISDKAAADHIRLAKAWLSRELGPAHSAHAF